MKKVLFVSLALMVVLSMTVAASDAGKKETTLTGWVTDPMCGVKHAKEGGEACVKSCAKDGKLAFVTDGGSKVLAVENSESLKGHEGHHVKVTGLHDEDKGTLKVVTVAMLGGDKNQSTEAHSHDDAVKKDVKVTKEKKTVKKEEKKEK